MKSEIEQIESQIAQLEKESNYWNSKAMEAYQLRDYKLEDEYQKEIDSRKNRISELKNKLVDIKYKDIDFEKEIEIRRKQHQWDSDITEVRCNKCSMKNLTTFAWKVEGVRSSLKENDKANAMEILEGMECKRYK